MKITFRGVGCVNEADMESNHQNSLASGYPFIQHGKGIKQRVAAVGGGPSIEKHLEELRAWRGPIWAVNATSIWCRERGIDATAFVLDPQDDVHQFVKGATKALVGTGVHPTTLDALKGADIRLFNTGPKNGIGACGTAVTVVPTLAGRMGYAGVKFFGCDSSYGPEKSHAYFHWHNPLALKVKCGDEIFITDPALVIQVEALFKLINMFPHFLSATDDGFLGALLRAGADKDGEPQYDVLEVTPELLATMTITTEAA